MPKGVKINVVAKVLLFARKSAGFSVDEIVTKLKRKTIDQEVIMKWERTGGAIPLPVLRDIAKYYKRPLTFFFLRNPPQKPIIPADFRTLPNDGHALSQMVNLSPKAMLMIRRAKRAQELAYQISLSLGKNLKKKLPKISLKDDPAIFAQKIRQTLGVSIEKQSQWKEPRIALKAWINLLEKQGIIVQQDSLELEENFRGFSLAGNHKLLPLIFLSTKDAPNGKIFTLLHEYCHLMLNESGVNIKEDSVSFNKAISRIEKFCNEFAASFLVPKDLLLSHEIVAKTQKNSFSEDNLHQLAWYFAVSKEVITLRLKKVGKVDQAFYKKKKQEWSQIETKPPFGRKAWELRYLDSNSFVVTALVYESYHKNLMNLSDLLSTLNFKGSYLEKVEDSFAKHLQI